jgi:hypothetical protein
VLVILDAVPAEDAQSFTQRRNQTIRSFFRSVRRAQSMLSAICRRSCGLGVEPEDFVEHPLIAFSLGRRDAEAAISREETLENARAIVAATDLPVSADLEDGFGYRPEDAAETIRRAAEIGLVGGSIEDTTADPVRPLHELGRKSRVVLRDEGALAVDGPNLRLRLFRLSRGDRHTLWLRTGS